jgi:spore maturation protein CgeB
MRVVLFYHSLISDWNHGNAHFLRGIVRELQRLGQDARVFEPANGWSLRQLIAEQGAGPIVEFGAQFPTMHSSFYDPDGAPLDILLDGADLVLVHEWNDPELVRAIGQHHRRRGDYVLLFHDTHHRSITAPDEMQRYDLDDYDGVLAFGEIIRDIYLGEQWAPRAWTWHEAADTDLFRPLPAVQPEPSGDLVWVGNWGDGERSRELHDYLIGPVEKLKLRARVHGVRYPQDGLAALRRAGIDFAGWRPNYRVPEIFANFRCTLHLPRRPYREQLPGIPTIRVFEALACGIPLICLQWDDAERLFTPGADYLVADSPDEMADQIRAVLRDPELARRLAEHGLATIHRRHTCRHRVQELLSILDDVRRPAQPLRSTLPVEQGALVP